VINDILNSTFGRAFLSHLLGIEASSAVRSFAGSSLGFDAGDPSSAISLNLGQIAEKFTHFIREYPFGEQRNWRNLLIDDHVSKLESAAEHFVPALSALGFSQPHEPHRQNMFSSVANSSPYWNESFLTQSFKRSTWWATPKAPWTFQYLHFASSRWAMDDSISELELGEVEPIVQTFCENIKHIMSAEDWMELVSAFPKNFTSRPDSLPYLLAGGAEGNLVLPDWAKVARAYDGVYLSPAGYLATSYTRLPLGQKNFTALTGWSPGATYILRR
jgi:hypothetical protein